MTGGRPLRVALDLGQVDNQTLGSGQYRYAVDLVSGLASIGPDVRLVLLGSARRPRDECTVSAGHRIATLNWPGNCQIG